MARMFGQDVWWIRPHHNKPRWRLIDRKQKKALKQREKRAWKRDEQ